MDTNNNTIEFNSVLQILCNENIPLSNQNITCTKNTLNNSLLIPTTTLTCKIYDISGCPTTNSNYFQQFLSNNVIAFAITIWIISLFELLLGYFAIRITIFLFGILSGLIFGVIFISQFYTDFLAESDGICIMIIMLSLVLGILLGITFLTLPRLGYINIGIWVAVVTALLLQNCVLYLTSGLLAFYITGGVLMLLMIIIALLSMKFFIIASTTFLSAFGMIRPLGFFLPFYPN